MSVKFKARRNNILIGAIGVLVSIVLFLFFDPIVRNLTEFIETHFSADNHLRKESIANLESHFFMVILVLVILSIFVFFNLFGRTIRIVSILIDKDSIVNFFLTDSICSKKRVPLFLFVTGTTIGVLMHMYYLLFGDPPQEGFIEEFSSLFFLFAGIILLLSTVKIKKKRVTPVARKQLRLTLIALGIIVLFIFGEEMNWGQRIFNWESEGVFKEYNFQGQTSTHNFFNPLFKYIYPLVGMTSFIILVLAWFFPSQNRSYFFQLVIPHVSLFPLCFIMACFSFSGHSEIYEELLGLFFLLHSIRILMCILYPRDDASLKPS